MAVGQIVGIVCAKGGDDALCHKCDFEAFVAKDNYKTLTHKCDGEARGTVIESATTNDLLSKVRYESKEDAGHGGAAGCSVQNNDVDENGTQYVDENGVQYATMASQNGQEVIDVIFDTESDPLGNAAAFCIKDINLHSKSDHGGVNNSINRKAGDQAF